MNQQKGQAGIVFLVIGAVIGLILLTAVVGTFFKLFTLPWFQFSTKVNQNQNIITKTYDADNQIYNYHWFQETAGSIQALDSQITNAQEAQTSFEAASGDRSTWTFEDKNEDSRLRSIVLGLKNQRESLTKEYNARANEADRGIFQNGLKTYIPLN